MDLLAEFDAFERTLAPRDWDALEAHYREKCATIAGEERARIIAAVDCRDFAAGVAALFAAAAEHPKIAKVKALYFEYDLDNAWDSGLFLCTKYKPRKAEDDEWACDYLATFEGPSLPAFGTLYGEDGFCTSDFDTASLFFMMARTVALFGRTVDRARARYPQLHEKACCIAFHDQDVAHRVIERGSTPTKLFLPPLVRRRLPEKAEPDQCLQLFIPPEYEELEAFSEGLAAVSREGKWGFIDYANRLAIPMQFDKIGNFADGLAPAAIEGKWGYLDRDGEWAIPPQYEWARSFNNGCAVIKVQDRYGCLDTAGRFLHEPYFEAVGQRGFSEGLLAVLHAGKWGFINTSGELVIAAEFGSPELPDRERAPIFSEGLAAVTRGERCAYIDHAGNIQLEFPQPGDRFDLRPFSEGIAVIDFRYWSGRYIDRAGNVLAEGDNCRAFSDGVALLSHARGHVFIDRTGKVVLKAGKRPNRAGRGPSHLSVDFLDNFHEGLASVMVKGESAIRTGYLNHAGEIVLLFDYHVFDFAGGVAQISVDASTGKKYGYVDTVGRLIADPVYEYASGFADGLGLIRNDGQHGYLASPAFIATLVG
jgi:hypothetical protein